MIALVPGEWLEDGDRFAPQIRQIIGEVARRHPIDRGRIYVVGASNGGYMSLKMTTVHRDLFAASVPICGVVTSLQPGGPVMITDEELRQRARDAYPAVLRAVTGG